MKAANVLLFFFVTSLQQIPSSALDELTASPSCSENYTLGQDVRRIPSHQLPFSMLGIMIVQTLCKENLAKPPSTLVHRE